MRTKKEKIEILILIGTLVVKKQETKIIPFDATPGILNTF